MSERSSKACRAMRHAVLCLCGLWLSSICSTAAATPEVLHSLAGDIFFPRGMPRPEPSNIQVRVDVTQAGHTSLTYTEFPEQSLQMPLVIRAARVDYFDAVQRFDVLGFMKSPMGLLGAFVVFAMFLSPYLKVDPEELETYQKEVEEAKAAKAAKALRSAEAACLPPAPLPASRTTSTPSRAAGSLTSAKQRNRRQ